MGGSGTIWIHGGCCSTPYRFSFDSPVTIVSLDFSSGSSSLISDKGDTISLSTNGTIPLGWDNISYFDWHGGSGTIDNLVISACAPSNNAPEAVCKPATVYLNPSTVSITGADVDGGSTDPDGDTLALSVSPSSFNCNNTGPNLVTLTVSDGEDSDSCTTTVTVIDNISPVLSGVPADVTVECDSVPAPASPTASDNCDGAPEITFSETRTDGNCPGNYTLTRKWTAKDDTGNSSNQSQVITVQDTTAPVLSGVPADVTVECDSVPAPASPTASDNCDTAPEIAFSETRTDGDCPSNYTLTRTWTATDACSNASSETQVVTVQDTTAPVLSGVPADVTVDCDSVPDPASPTASDNCDTAPEIAFSETRTDGDCPSNYTLTRTWTATDACSNASSETQVVTVQDTTKPVVTATLVPVKLKKRHGCFRVEFSATDNCDDEVSLSAELNGHPVTDGELVRLYHRKIGIHGSDDDSSGGRRCRVKVKGEGSSDDDSGSDDDSSADCGDVKFMCNVFTLTVTATDDCGNVGTGTAEHVFPDDGSSDDDKGHGNDEDGSDDDNPGKGWRRK